LYSDDALKLQQASSIKLDYDFINPHAYEPAIAPHIAARNSLNVQTLNRSCHYSMHYPADICLIEGVGGWYVPLNQHETMSDFVISNQLPVILVAGIRLGCLNHALLTVRAMQQDGAKLIGWVANCVDGDMLHADENITTLQHWLPIPCLGVARYRENPEMVPDWYPFTHIT
jgi:dethiobiotin synthetase